MMHPDMEAFLLRFAKAGFAALVAIYLVKVGFALYIGMSHDVF